jgi:hypothetical protein
MNTHFQILIIGGGNAGLSVAAQLLRKNKSLQIGIIEPSEKHYYQPAWTLVGAGIFDINATEKKQINYIPKAAHWIKDAAETFEPESNLVRGKSGKQYYYDTLIVSPGIQLDWFKIKGLKEIGYYLKAEYSTKPIYDDRVKIILKSNNFTVSIEHQDGWYLTSCAILSALLYHLINKKQGIYSMGDYVNPEIYIDTLKKLGIKIEITNGNN